MLKITLLFLSFTITCQLHAQENLPDLDAKQGNEKEAPVVATDKNGVAMMVETIASFKGGAAALNAFIKQNMVYPATATNTTGKCFLKFIVNENGSISNITILKPVVNCNACDQEALTLVSKMPAWEPATLHGETVKSYYNLSVDFKKP